MGCHPSNNDKRESVCELRRSRATEGSDERFCSTAVYHIAGGNINTAIAIRVVFSFPSLTLSLGFLRSKTPITIIPPIRYRYSRVEASSFGSVLSTPRKYLPLTQRSRARSQWYTLWAYLSPGRASAGYRARPARPQPGRRHRPPRAWAGARPSHARRTAAAS